MTANAGTTTTTSCSQKTNEDPWPRPSVHSIAEDLAARRKNKKLLDMNDPVGELEERLSALAEKMNRLQQPSWYGEIVSVIFGISTIPGPKQRYGHLLLRVRRIRRVLMVLIVLVPAYVFWTWWSASISLFPEGHLSINNLPDICLATFMLLVGGACLAIPTLMFINGLTYRIIHINKLERRIQAKKEIDNGHCITNSPESNTTYLRMKSEVDDLPWKIGNPAEFLPGKNDWARESQSDAGVFVEERREQYWDTMSQRYRLKLVQSNGLSY